MPAQEGPRYGVVCQPPPSQVDLIHQGGYE